MAVHQEEFVYSTLLRLAVFSLACIAGTSAVLIQANAEKTASRNGKIGVIDLRATIESTGECRQALAEVQTQFAQRNKELESINQQLAAVRNRLQSGSTLGQAEELALASRLGQHLAVQLDLKNKELNEDLRAARAEVEDRVGRRVKDLVSRYSRENGYATVLDTSTPNSVVVYGSNDIDITRDIVCLYDEAYPSKGTTSEGQLH